MEDPDDDDLRRVIAGDQRRANRLGGLLLQYTVGEYSAGVEWIGARTEWGRGTDALSTARTAHQLAFSVLYRFDSRPPVLP